MTADIQKFVIDNWGSISTILSFVLYFLAAHMATRFKIAASATRSIADRVKSTDANSLKEVLQAGKGVGIIPASTVQSATDALDHAIGNVAKKRPMLKAVVGFLSKTDALGLLANILKGAKK